MYKAIALQKERERVLCIFIFFVVFCRSSSLILCEGMEEVERGEQSISDQHKHVQTAREKQNVFSGTCCYLPHIYQGHNAT